MVWIYRVYLYWQILFYVKFLLMLIIIVGAFDYLFEFDLQQVAQNKTVLSTDVMLK